MLYVLTAAFILAVHNATFWSRTIAVLGEHPFSMLAFGISVFGIALFTVSLLGFRWLQKPVAAGLLILAAVTSYYQDVLGATIDREMIQNAMNTTQNEAKHLVSFGFISHVVLRGVLPALLVFWVQIKPSSLWRHAFTWAGTVVLGFSLFLGMILLDFKTLSSVIREHKEIRVAIQPGQPIAAAFKYTQMILRTQNVVVAPLGTDAKRSAALVNAGKPALTVIVVGETARAENFSLNGYARDTNPALKARSAFYFTDVKSCGTSTAVSMPCMFSNLTSEGYSYQAGRSNENLLDVLGHAKIKTIWLDNNTGDLGVAARTDSTNLTGSNDPVSCAKGECEDSIFLPELKKIADTMTTDTVVVLHQIGSHGPAYFLRYPPDFEPFKPACQFAEFAKCSGEEITNAYDNTIAYTDKFLGDVIDMLQGETKVITSMVYLSDHGESLGEGGLYLHGAPYFMAPSQQTHVPMAMWFSENYKTAFGLQEACLRGKTGLPLSQDNLFHTALAMAGVETSARNEELNLLNGCQK